MGVRTYPTFVYIRNGKVVRRIVGYRSADSIQAMFRPPLW